MNDGEQFRGFWWVIVVLALSSAGVIFALKRQSETSSVAITSQRISIAQHFAFVSQNGDRVTDGILSGKPYLAFFGSSACASCINTLSELSAMLAMLGEESDRLNIVLISVDPERDTEQALASFMDAFDPRIMALRGPREQADAVFKAFGAARGAAEGTQSTTDPSSEIYLVDRDGRYAGNIRMGQSREDRMNKLHQLIG